MTKVTMNHHKPSSIESKLFHAEQQIFPFNNKVINCLKDDNPLIRKKSKEVSVEQGLAIAEKLFQILDKRGDGIGLAANQVGINAQVAVVKVREPLVLINPKILSKYTKIPFHEGCLSYPNKGVHTQRYRDVLISTDQSESNWYFSGVETSKEGKGSWEDASVQYDNNQRLLESIAIQHEIDHLNGITIHDRRIETTVKVDKKIGRNQLVTIKKGDAVKVLKYKKINKFLSDGWSMEA